VANAVQKVINGRTYSIGRMSCEDQIHVEVFLARSLGGVDISALSSANVSAVGLAVFAQCAKNLNADELIQMMTKVFSAVSCDGKAVDLNVTFAGRGLEKYQALLESLKVNFADFIDAFRSASSQGEKAAV